MNQITVYWWVTFSEFKEEHVLLRNRAVTELKTPLFSQHWKKVFKMKKLIACVLELHLFYAGPNS